MAKMADFNNEHAVLPLAHLIAAKMNSADDREADTTTPEYIADNLLRPNLDKPGIGAEERLDAAVNTLVAEALEGLENAPPPTPSSTKGHACSKGR